MPERDYRLYSYRWVELGVFMFINLAIQILWISYAPITGPAAKFYGVSDLYSCWPLRCWRSAC